MQSLGPLGPLGAPGTGSVPAPVGGTPPVAAAAPIRAVVAIADTPGPSGAPLSVRVGQELLAEVLSLDDQTGRALLSMGGRRFNAQVPVPVNEGQVLRVAVADVSADRLLL